MGAHGRTNPERLPRGGGTELKWKQRAGAVWEATETKAAAEGTPPSPVSHPRRGNHTSTPYCSLRMERQHPARGGGAWHPLWAYLARGSGGSGVPQLGPPPACHCFKPCHVAGQAGITPNPQETDRAQRLALLRPAVGAAPDTHACCLLQGPNFAQPCGAHGPEACSDLKGKPIKDMATATGVWGLPWRSPGLGKSTPLPGSPTPLSCPNP